VTEPETTALVRRPGDGELIEAAGVDHFFRLTAADSGGRLALEEFSLAPATMGARPHVHHAHDEYFYILEGELTVHDGTGEFAAGPGHLVAAVRGTPHGFRNAGSIPVRGLCMFTPAGYEDYFRQVHAAVSAGAEPTDALLTELRSHFDTTPWPPA
jgi:mannose-6-phosphate isomerase-like protein (cupin superfamily)